MKLRVLVFGSLAQATGRRAVEVEVAPGAVGADVVRAVARRHPAAAAILERVSIAVNRVVVPPEHAVSASDEVALLPPVSGGTAVTVGLREAPSVDEVLEAVRSPGAGGTAVFLGTVRDRSEAGEVRRLDYEAYEEMATAVMADIAEEAVLKWGLLGAAILHGVGRKVVGEITIIAACSAPHRQEAFEACRFTVNEVKRRVPVWKKETGPWGERWV